MAENFASDGRVALRRAPDGVRLIVRGGDAAIGGIGEAFGVALPATPCRAAERAARAALWLGPDEWLLLAPDANADVLAATLEAAAGGEPVSIVDVSHRQLGFELDGPDAATLLNAGCPLDLHAEAFAPGACTRTLFDKAEIVLWRRSAPGFRLEVARSFADYLVGMLEIARRDLAAAS